MRVVSLVMVLLVLAPFSLSAQRYDDSITVNVVEVPVYVERFGAPVAGLTRDDFELFVNGHRQPIEYFDVLGEASEGQRATDEAAPGLAPAPSELKRRRLVVLLFDTGGSSAYPLQRARVKALQYLAADSSADTYAVATIGRRGVRFLVPFTTDRIAVQRAIGTLAPSEAADPFQLATLAGERSAWHDAVVGGEAGLRSAVDTWGGGPRGGFGVAGRAVYPSGVALERAARDLTDRPFINALSDLADRLAPLSGVKHVVLLSERRDVDAGNSFELILRLHERYREAGVVLDGVDIRFPVVPGGNASSAGPDRGAPDLLLSGFLYALALDTGGTVAASLTHLQTLNGVTYVLGFLPPPAGSRTNSIRVRVKDRRLLTEVRYRRSYTVDTDTRDDSLFLADTLLNDIPQRGVTLDLDVKGMRMEASIPGAELLAHGPGNRLALDVFFYVFDESGRAVVWNQLRLNVDLAAGRDFLTLNPYTIRQELRLRPGRYAAKALIRIAGTEMTGFRRTDFVVPAS